MGSSWGVGVRGYDADAVMLQAASCKFAIVLSFKARGNLICIVPGSIKHVPDLELLDAGKLVSCDTLALLCLSKVAQ